MTKVASVHEGMVKKSPKGRETLNDRSVRAKKAAEKGRRDLYHDALVPGMALRVTDTGHKSYVLITRYPLKPQHPTPRTLGVCYLPSEGTPEVDAPTRVQSGALTLAEARDKARTWIDLIQRGIDPKIEEERQRAAELRKQNHSFEAIATAFLERHVKGPAFLELEAQAEALMAEPENKKMQKGAAIRKVSALAKNKALVEKAKTQGISKKLEADRIMKQEFIERWAIRPVVDIMPEEVSAAIRAIVDRGSPYQAHNAYG